MQAPTGSRLLPGTPGGPSVDACDGLEAIENSTVPVVIYISPAGSRRFQPEFFPRPPMWPAPVALWDQLAPALLIRS